MSLPPPQLRTPQMRSVRWCVYLGEGGEVHVVVQVGGRELVGYIGVDGLLGLIFEVAGKDVSI